MSSTRPLLIQVRSTVYCIIDVSLCSSAHSFIHPFIHYISLTSPFTWLTPPGPNSVTACRDQELTLDHIHTFLPHKDMEGLPGWGITLNAGATSETTQTWKTIHTIHAPIHSKKATMKGWLWRSNDIRGPCVPKASWCLSYRWGKNLKKNSPRKLVPNGHRTRDRWFTGVHATSYSTAVDMKLTYNSKIN